MDGVRCSGEMCKVDVGRWRARDMVRTRGDDVILAGKGTAAEGDLNYGLSNILTKPMGTFPACLRT